MGGKTLISCGRGAHHNKKEGHFHKRMMEDPEEWVLKTFYLYLFGKGLRDE